MKVSFSTRPGFTLIELLVIIAIFAVLAAVLFPVFHRPRGCEIGRGCKSNLKQVVTALQMYAFDYNERFPPHAFTAGTQSHTLPSLLHPYIKNRTTWQCSNSQERKKLDSDYDGSPADTSVSFGYNWSALSPGGKGITLQRVAKPEATVSFAESSSYRATPSSRVPALGGTPPSYRHSGCANVAYVDGHVKSLGRQALETAPLEEDGTPLGSGIDAFEYWNLR